jgi:P-type Ca2+ transporter type 2C
MPHITPRPRCVQVKEAVATAQRAGVMVRMVTGDNIHTAKAIARDCGILREGGVALEGPNFRAMTPAQASA